MAVYFVTGNLGGGKSLMSVNRIKDYLSKGYPVATNLDIKLHHMFPHSKKDVALFRIPDKPSLEDFEMIGSGNTSYDENLNGLIVLDECGTWFNSRTWADKERQKIIDWLLHARKWGWDVIFIVQNIAIVDKQARLALGEHVVHCRRTDRMNIPLLGPIFKAFFGGKLPLPRVHIGVVKYGLLPTSLTVDTWTSAGSGLFLTYDTKQVFSDHYDKGVYSVLPPWLTHGRYATKRTWGFYMRLTKIYAKKYSRFFIFSLGAILTFFITEALSYKEDPPAVPVETKEKLIQDESINNLSSSSHPPADREQVNEPEQLFEWRKMSTLQNGNVVKVIHNGVHSLINFPYKVKYQDGWYYAYLPVSEGV